MTSEAMKLIDLIKQREEFMYSFEVTPDVNKEEINNLELDPLFFSVTWHAKSHKCKDLEVEPLKTASFLKSKQKQVLMHLSCDLMRKQYLERVLAFLQEKEICNLFLVLGESFDPRSSDFGSTLELLQYIREISGQYFCIGVAGFCESNDEKLLQLKEKVDAGADFIITQAFFEANVYKKYLQNCAAIGIKVPVIPGVFAFENHEQLTNFIKMCKVKVSNDILEYVKTNGTNIAAIQVLQNLIQTIGSDFPGINFHFFTLNKLQSICSLIKQIKN